MAGMQGEQRAKMAFRTEVAGRQLWPKINGVRKAKSQGGRSTDGKSVWKATVSGKQMWLKANVAGRKWLMECKDGWKTKVKECQGGCKQWHGWKA